MSEHDNELLEGMTEATDEEAAEWVKGLQVVQDGEDEEPTHESQAVANALVKLRENLHRVEDLDELPLPQWQIDDRIIQGSLTYLAGAPGHGKSFVAVSMAACVSSGHPWFGQQVIQSPVLYVAAEGVQGVRKRIRVWEHQNQVELSALDVLGMPVQIDIRDPFWAAFGHLVREGEYGLIVIDTQARCTSGKDENAQMEMSLVIGLLEELRAETGATILVVHHSSKGSQDPGLRGSSALTGACEAIIGVKRTHLRKKNAAAGADPTKIEVSCVRQKDAEHFDDLHFDLLNVDLGPFDSAILRPGTPAKAKNGVNTAVVAAQNQASQIVKAGGGVTVDIRRGHRGFEYGQRWASLFGAQQRTAAEIMPHFPEYERFESLLKAMTAAGIQIEKSKAGAAGHTLTYWLSDHSFAFLHAAAQEADEAADAEVIDINHLLPGGDDDDD